MFKLAVLAFAASNVAGTPLHQNAIGDKTIIVTFDGLTVRHPHVTTSIGVYDGLNFSNICMFSRLYTLLSAQIQD